MWEQNPAAMAGLAAAVELAMATGIETIAARTLGLATRLRRGLARTTALPISFSAQSVLVGILERTGFYPTSVSMRVEIISGDF